MTDAPPNQLDPVDRRLIAATQAGLPLVARPYEAVAEQMGIPAAEVMQRLARLLERGAIRRIAAIPNHYALGYRANGMSVWDVADDVVDDLGRKVGALGFVSHCYTRPRHLPHWPYNLFAMLHGRSRDEVLSRVDTVAGFLGAASRRHDVLFSSRILKKTGLRLSSERQS